MYIVGADRVFDHDLEKALFNIKCNTLLLLSLHQSNTLRDVLHKPAFFFILAILYGYNKI